MNQQRSEEHNTSTTPQTTARATDLRIETGDGLEGDRVVLAESDGHVAHRDLGRIPATELDGITINRTKSNLDPFVDIRKERLVDRLSGAPSKSFGIWVPDPEAEGGWRDMGTVSENYLLLTNEEVRELDLEIAERSGLPYRESRIFWDGARFAHVIDFGELVEEVTEDDPVGLSLVTRTSYDRSWKFEASLMGKRFACDNGCLSGEFFARVSFKHLAGDGENWQEIVRQGLSVIDHSGDNLRRFVQGLRTLQRTRMSDEHLRTIWKLFPRMGPTTMGKLMSRYVQHEEDTLYGLFNAGTHLFYNSEKLRATDFSKNDRFTTGLLRYAFEHLN